MNQKNKTMKTLHTILTILFGLDIIYATYQFVSTISYFNENNTNASGSNILAIFVGSYLFAAILFTARYFVGKKLNK